MYNHLDIEKNWRQKWQDADLYKTPEIDSKDAKKYILETFPYPSGYAMHVGHAKGYVASDITARFWRLKQHKVLYPIGWDAFGLPAENYAIKTGIHPRPNTDQTIVVSKEQLHKIGLSYDWSRELATHRPDYYKWTQWFFQLLYKRGLAYKKEAVVNWDPVDQTVLANEQVLPDGTGERSGAKVEQRKMNQWFFKITDYADRLLEGLDRVDWPESTRLMQKNWIGKSEGINITYKLEEVDSDITVYTTRPDTNFGATFIVVAPDSNWVKDNFNLFKYKEKCQEYIDKTKLKTELDRLSEGKVKTGEFTGLHAINPLNGQKLPIYLSDFVLSSVGTGAVVGVPGHDERDFDFAKAKHLPIIRVVVSPDGDTSEITQKEQVQEASGTMINSIFLDGLPIMEAKEKIKDYIEEQGFGKRVTNYRLRDWLVSRQRYWGSPIPVYYTGTKIKVLFASTNKDKLHRLKMLTQDLNLEILSLLDLGLQDLPEPDETGKSEQENALIKAKYYYEKLNEKMLVIAQDDGVYIPEIPVEFQPGKDVKATVLKHMGKNDQHATYEYFKMLAGKFDNPKVIYNWSFAVYDGVQDYTVKQEINGILTTTTATNFEQIVANGAPLSPITLFKILDKQVYFSDLTSDDYKVIAQKECLDLVSKLSQIVQYQSTKLVPESNLPVILPEDVEFHPTGRSPLIGHNGFHQNATEKYGPGVIPEVDTMDTFVCSSWYFFRYCSPQNSLAFSDTQEMKKWMPVDQYIIGPEHANLHLLYARFFTKVLYDAGYIDFDEPFLQVRHPGLLMGEDGRKMSKRWGNVVNPDDIIKEYGADTLRMYEMFMGPFKECMPWSSSTVKGVRRFLDKVWKLQDKIYIHNDQIIAKLEKNGISYGPKTETTIETGLNILIKEVTEDIQNHSFNTAVAEYMKFVNLVDATGAITEDQFKRFLIVLYPFAPFISEELYSKLEFVRDETVYYRKKDFLQQEFWPTFDPEKIKSATSVIAIQINGKLRHTVEVDTNITKEDLITLIENEEPVTRWLNGKTVSESIKAYIPGKIVSLVVK